MAVNEPEATISRQGLNGIPKSAFPSQGSSAFSSQTHGGSASMSPTPIPPIGHSHSIGAPGSASIATSTSSAGSGNIGGTINHHPIFAASSGPVASSPSVASSPISLWASPPPKSSSEGLSATTVTPLRGRARAGTLPSRLPPLSMDRLPPTGALGSLALLSPEGNNEVLWDAPTDPSPPGGISSGASVSGLSSASGIGPSLQPRTSSTTNRSRSGSLNSLAFSPFPSIWNGATAPGNNGNSAGTVPPSLKTSPSPPLLSGPPVSGVGSISSIPSIPSIPSLSSISSMPAVPTLSGVVNPSDSLMSSLSTTPTSKDGVRMYATEYQNRGELPRIRSYTLTSTLDSVGWPPSSLGSSTSAAAPTASSGSQHGIPTTSTIPAISGFGRPRAHTLVSGPPMHSTYGNLGLNKSFLQDNTPESQVLVLNDLSSVPTPAVWITNVPPTATSYQMHALFSGYGRVENARIIPAHGCACITFATVASAIDAQAATNGMEIYTGRGPSTVGFAKIIDQAETPEYGEHFDMSVLGKPQASSLGSKSSTPVTGGLNGLNGLNGMVINGLNGTHNLRHNHSYHVAQTTNAINGNLGSSGFGNLGTAGGMGSIAANLEVTRDGDNNSSNPGMAGPSPGEADNSSEEAMAYILQVLEAPPHEVSQSINHYQRAALRIFSITLADHQTKEEAGSPRVYTAGVLRDIRRRIEAIPHSDVDELALDMQNELPVLASDYIGNTVVQVLFERASPIIKDMMLRRLAPVMAQTGTHKNGTWAAQKIIDLVDSPRQYRLVEEAIRPHLVVLLLDQFGNYVVQGCLKFGSPWNDFVYAGVASLLPMIAPDRFGARAICAILKSPRTTVRQQRLVAAAIVQNAVHLAANANGSLLLNWLLDSFAMGGPDRFTLVAEQLVPHLLSMCTSKSASSIILKLVINGQQSQAARCILDVLLEPTVDTVPPVLAKTLLDPAGHGATFLFRLLTTALSESSVEKQVAVNKIRMVLLQPGAQIPPHKRLLEEVGLSVLADAAPSAQPSVPGQTGASGQSTPSGPSVQSIHSTHSAHIDAFNGTVNSVTGPQATSAHSSTFPTSPSY